MNKKTKIVLFASSGIVFVVLGLFAFVMMVSSPYVIGSNVDPVTKSISANAPFKVTFSGLMNHEKTEHAFAIEPAIKGRFEWQGNTMFFFPTEPLKIGDHYTVTIRPDAESMFGKKMEQEYWVEFIVQGPPEVIFAAPKDIVVGKEAKIVVMFNQPMITLTDLDNQTTDNIKIQITPQTKGVIQWIDTSSFQFIPQDHLTYASKYTVVVEKGSTSLDGGMTEQDYTFSFETIHPRVVSLEPENNYDLAGPFTPLKIHFNQPIDLTSLQQNVHITPETSVSYGYDEKDPNTIILKPDGGLKLKTAYNIILGKNIKGKEGDFTLGEDISWQFKTVGKPLLSSSDPKDNQQDADVYSVSLYFSNPMDKNSLKDKVILTPDAHIQVATEDTGDEDTTVVVTGDFQYSTSYTMTIKAGGKDIYGQTIDKDITLSFTTKARDPYLKIARKDYFNLFSGYQNPVYPLKTINLDEVQAYFCQLSQEEYLKRVFSYVNDDPQNCLTKKTWTIKTSGKKNEMTTHFIDFGSVLGKGLDSGIYYLAISSDKIPNDWEKKDYVTFFVSKTSLTMKLDNEKVLIWATDLATGLPVPDEQITLVGENNKQIASGKTDGQGLFETPFNFDGNLYVIGKRGDDVSYLSRYWSNGISPWDFGYGSDWRRGSPVFAYLYTDRPIYRPGQKVFFKGILRVDHDARFTIPDMKKVSVEMMDAEGNQVYKKEMQVNDIGTFSGEFLLDKSASTGMYQVYASVGEENFYQNFMVEEYRKPEFQVKIVPTQLDYTDGDTLKATISANYYFGGALKHKKVTWTINAMDYYFSDYEGEWYSFTDNGSLWYCYEGCEQQQSFVTSGEGTLDDNGNLTISVPLSLKGNNIDQLYTLEATIEDSSHQTVSNRETVKIHKGNYMIGVRSEDYALNKGDSGNFKVLLLDLNKKPVQGKQVKVALYERVWNQVQKKNIDNEFYTEYEPKDTLLQEKTVTTDDTGKAKGSFTFEKGGEMVIKASVQDEKGRTLQSSTSVYVSDKTFISWYTTNDSRIDLVPDKQKYHVGDTANILIKSPFENVKALLTYERRNILEHKIIDITSTSQTIEVPITDQFIPNVYVSVVLMKGGGGVSKEKIRKDIQQIDDMLQTFSNHPDLDPQIVSQQTKDLLSRKSILQQQLQSDVEGKPDYRVGYTNLYVNTDTKKINVSLHPDKDRYLPREKPTIAITTTNAQGKPLPCEVSVAVVDQSVLALSTKEEDILSAFYGKKDLGVETASAMSIFTDTVVVKTGKAKGGDGVSALPANIRGNFKDTAYFTAQLKTDQNGQGKVSFDLPDNLTTWKVMVVAVNKDTLVGSNTISFLTTKDLMIRPALPRFFRNGDELNVTAIIQNGQRQDDTITAVLEIVEGDITLQSNKTISLTVPKDNERQISWKIKVGNGTSATLLFKAKGNTAEDNVQIKLPVLSYATPEVVATFGETDSSRTEHIRFSDTIAKDQGSIMVRVYPSLITHITKGLETLIHYPYGCAEQVMSALLSTVSSKTVYTQMGQPLPDIAVSAGTMFENEKIIAEKDPQKRIDLMIQTGLQKIYGFQHADGGWGYWTESSESYPYLSSYVLFGLAKIKEAGYAVDDKVMQKGVDFLNTYMKQHSLKATQWKDGKKIETDSIDPYKANERSFALYVLSTMKKGDLGMINNLYDVRSNLYLYAKGYLLMTLQNMGQKEKATTVLNELLSNLIEDTNARTAHFEEKNNDTLAMNTDLKTTAIILQGMIQMDSKNPLIPKMVRYLVYNKTYEKYVNTQEMTYTLFALIDYLKTLPAPTNTITTTVHLNNENLLEATLDNTKNTEASAMKNIADVVGKNNELVFEKRSGEGHLYYDIVAKYFVPLLHILPRNNGLTVKREYFAFTDDKMQKPLSMAKVGDILKGKLTIIVPKDRNFVAIESHLPAGMEAVNFNLATSQQGLASQVNTDQNNLWGDKYWASGLWHFNHIESRDDRVVLFADHLPAGVYEYEYVVRTTTTGIFANPPVLGYEMYFPEIFGRSRGEIFTVTD
jgi:hypothetical protein